MRCDAWSAVSITMSRTVDARPFGRYFWEWDGPGGENAAGRAGAGTGGAGRRNLGGSDGGGDDGEGPGMRKRGWLGGREAGRGGVRMRVLVKGAGDEGGEDG